MKLYWKLFLALFAAVLVGAGALALLSQWRLDRGFIEYVNAADAELLPGLAEVAARVYQESGDWNAVRDNPRRWFRPVRLAIQLQRRADPDEVEFGRPGGRERRRPPPPRRFERGANQGPPPGAFDRPRSGPMGDPDEHFERRGPPPRREPPPRDHALPGAADRGPPPPPPRRRDMLHERVALVDQDGAVVASSFDPAAGMPSAPVVVAGITVGRVVMQPVDRPGSAQDDAFLLAQRDWLLRAVLIMLPIAGLIAYFLARHLLAPIHAISAAARKLASGDYGARVGESGSDEFSRLGQDFNVLGRALAEHDGARRRWMADAAHELRTPLAVLQGEIEALQDGIRPTNELALRGLHSQTLRLGTLVNDLQQLALADAGALNYRMEYLAIDEHLLEAADAHRNRLQQAGIELQLLPETVISAQVLGDAQRLRQLFDNLIENSLRYTRGPGKLQLRRQLDAHSWTVYFDDSEPGVNADRCEQLFEPFVRDPERLRNSPLEAGGGGLGLAICRRIAQAHQAELQAAPSALGGLSVRLSIPITRSTE